MPITVIGLDKLQGALREVREHIGDSPSGRRRLMNQLGLAMRNATRNNITSQGDGQWAPLSWWVRQKTGRRKALITLRDRIKHRSNADRAEVYFEVSSPYWDLDTHHYGRKSAAVRGKKMVIPLRGRTLRIRNRKATRIPARKVWASKQQIQTEGERRIQNWLEELRLKVQR